MYTEQGNSLQKKSEVVLRSNHGDKDKKCLLQKQKKVLDLKLPVKNLKMHGVSCKTRNKHSP